MKVTVEHDSVDVTVTYIKKGVGRRMYSHNKAKFVGVLLDCDGNTSQLTKLPREIFYCKVKKVLEEWDLNIQVDFTGFFIVESQEKIWVSRGRVMDFLI